MNWFITVGIVIITCIILIFYYLNTKIENRTLNGIWEAPTSFCNDAKLSNFCLCLIDTVTNSGDKYRILKSLSNLFTFAYLYPYTYTYNGYLLISNTAGILVNQDIQIKLQHTKLKIKKSNSEYYIDIKAEIQDWTEYEEILPKHFTLRYWPKKCKIMLFSHEKNDTDSPAGEVSTSDTIHAILYKNAELSENIN